MRQPFWVHVEIHSVRPGGSEGEWEAGSLNYIDRHLIAYSKSVLMTRQFCDIGAVSKTRAMAWAIEQLGAVVSGCHS